MEMCGLDGHDEKQDTNDARRVWLRMTQISHTPDPGLFCSRTRWLSIKFAILRMSRKSSSEHLWCRAPDPQTAAIRSTQAAAGLVDRQARRLILQRRCQRFDQCFNSQAAETSVHPYW